MTPFWVDASVFIDFHRRYHPVNRAHSFWAWMAKQVEEGLIVSPKLCYKEFAEHEDHQDSLAQWAKVRKEKGLCIQPSKPVQECLGEIQVHVFSKYDFAEAWDFSDGGDPWLIPHARHSGGIVVTRESTLHPKARKARIPDVCKHFGVQCIDSKTMLDALDAHY